jgi:adenylate cyclase
MESEPAGLLRDLKALGATDYIGLPLPYSDGRLTALALTTDAAGGFTSEQVEMVRQVSPLLGRLFEVHALRQTTINLLDTYLGAHAGERVYHGLIKRGDGENIRAVIWFSDMRGSTELSETLSQGAYLRALNEFLEAMAGAVIDAGGTVLKFIGDEVLGMFPIDPELGATAEHAAAAAMRAARDADARLGEVNAKRAAKDRPPLSYALALHVGEVMYGNVGAPSRLDFTVVGRAINEASRLEQLTRDAGRPVLVSQAFAEISSEPLEHVGAFSLRGLSAMQDVYGLPGQED